MAVGEKNTQTEEVSRTTVHDPHRYRPSALFKKLVSVSDGLLDDDATCSHHLVLEDMPSSRASTLVAGPCDVSVASVCTIAVKLEVMSVWVMSILREDARKSRVLQND